MKDYSLLSGERQTGRTVAEIRRDHTVRYEFAVRMIGASLPRNSYSCLDVFCGNGYGVFMMSQSFPDAFVLGVDGSREAVDMAADCYVLPNNLFSWKLFPFALPARAFDCVTCFESLEHVKDDRLMLERVLGSLKDDGFALISVPNEDCHSLKTNPNPFHFRHYRHQDFCEMVPDGYFIEKWYGQDVYEFSPEGLNKFQLLPPEELELREKVHGQVNIYVVRRWSEI